MKTRNLVFVAMACMGLLCPVHAAVLKVETPNTQLVLDATEGQQLAMLYYGDKSATMEDVRNQIVKDINTKPFKGKYKSDGILSDIPRGTDLATNGTKRVAKPSIPGRKRKGCLPSIPFFFQ